MSAILVVGYKGSELGIFNDKDQRISVIRRMIKKDLLKLIENGVDWLVFTGNLGFEFWVLEVAKDLQEEYPLQLATIFLFEDYGKNWNEVNREKLSAFKGVDYVKYAFKNYQNPGQFKQYHQFLMENTTGAYVFYSSENETNLKYLYEKLKDCSHYDLKTVTFDVINDFITDMEDEV